VIGARPEGGGAGTTGAEGEGVPAAPAAPRVRVAVVDVGSNSIRLVVADVAPDGGFATVEDYKTSPRLGAGLHDTGTLAPGAVRPALRALADMAARARALGAGHVSAVATSAVREAADGAAFVRRVQAETGLRLRALTGDEEARLAWRGAAAGLDLGAGRVAVADIGGGSLELALAADGRLVHVASFPLGAIRLTERHLRGGADADAVARLRAAARGAMAIALPLEAWRGARVVGAGGTFTTLAAIHLAAAGAPSDAAVHGATVPRPALEALLERLRALTPTERARVPGLRPARADIIVAGLAVAAEVVAAMDADAVTVSGHGIRAGLLLEGAEAARRVSAGGRAAR
jgi:exopolyphosphatase/guanosine-5'-triphosphate,3'-diphosphate pyrophosphatase